MPLFRDTVFLEDGFNRALGNARIAIDALVRVDVKDLLAFVKRIDRADDDAIGVFTGEAGFGNDKGHGGSFPVILWAAMIERPIMRIRRGR